jgi:NiFe hydrogenase small subunit HydA
MNISRRDFLKLCGASAAAIGLTATDLRLLQRALANPNAPTVIWLQGRGCTESFLNRISTSNPKTAADVLINSINLTYHPNLMALAGDSAVAQAQKAYNAGGYVLVVEGGVPTKYGGNACWAWSLNGQDVTFQQAVQDLSSKAAAIVCAGTCAAWGGIPAAPPNPTGVKGIKALTGKTTVNIAGCPTHPDWMVWAIVQILNGNNIPLDAYGRPKALFGSTVHEKCPRRDHSRAITYGLDNACLLYMGCQGPVTNAGCPSSLWNNGQNWCIDANARCLGCTSSTFPASRLFPYVGGGNDEHSKSFLQENVGNCQRCHHGNTIGGDD